MREGDREKCIYHCRKMFSKRCVGTEIATRVELREHDGFLFLRGRRVNSWPAIQLLGFRMFLSAAK